MTARMSSPRAPHLPEFSPGSRRRGPVIRPRLRPFQSLRNAFHHVTQALESLCLSRVGFTAVRKFLADRIRDRIGRAISGAYATSTNPARPFSFVVQSQFASLRRSYRPVSRNQEGSNEGNHDHGKVSQEFKNV